MSNGLTNTQLVEYLGLPDDIIDALAVAESSEYVAKTNEFLTALFNKVLYSRVFSMDFTNPFKKYDSYPIKYGDSIENVFVEIPTGYKYDKDAVDPFTRVNPKVKALYASINYEMQYETTIYDSLLRRAAINEYGFMNLIDEILGALSKAVSIDEYFAQIRLLNNADLYANGFEEVLKGANDTETASIVCHKIVDVSSDFTHPQTVNNKAGVMNVTPIGRQIIVMKQTLKNSINLDFLTGLFNLNKVGEMPEIITVKTFQILNEDEELVGEDLDFVIIDTQAFDNHVALQDGGMIYNPKGKYTNHFYNLWKIFAFKTFNNARAFKLVDTLTEGDGE